MSNDENIKAIFRNNLARLLEQKNVPQRALAQFVGVSTATVSDWKNGKKMPLMDKIDRIASFFHVERSDLLNTFNYDDKDALKKYVKFKPKDKVVCDIADSMQKILNAITKENMQHPPSITSDEQALLDAYRNASERDKNLVDTILRISEK